MVFIGKVPVIVYLKCWYANAYVENKKNEVKALMLDVRDNQKITHI